MIGARFHMLTVVEEVEKIQFKTTSSRRYLCKCDCGNEIIALPSNLHRGATKSCGCWKKQTAGDSTRTHGMSQSDEYKIWAGINKRCNNPNHKDFHVWGGKGIKVCERWKDFANFYSDMGPRPSKQHSIDRIDPSKDYSPENCRWATDYEQSLNSSRTRKIVYKGEIMSLRELAKRINKSYYTLYSWVFRKNIPINIVESNCQLEPGTLAMYQGFLP